MTSRRTFASVATAMAVLATLAPSAAAAPKYQEYVALGDSWTADVVLIGPPSAEHAPIDCAQSAANYPKLVATALGVATFRDASCGSATTEHFANPQTGLPLGGTNPPQFDRLTTATDLVTVGIGGNDAGLAGAVVGCLNLLPPLLPAPLGTYCKQNWVVGGVDRMSENIRVAKQKVIVSLREIKHRSPKARVLLVNYLAGLPRTGGCWPVVPVLTEDMEWLSAKLRELNAALRDAAAVTGAELVDTYTPTIGRDVCQGPFTRYVEGLIPLSLNGVAVAVPFHPNSAGANAQAQTVLRKIQG